MSHVTAFFKNPERKGLIILASSNHPPCISGLLHVKLDSQATCISCDACFDGDGEPLERCPAKCFAPDVRVGLEHCSHVHERVFMARTLNG